MELLAHRLAAVFIDVGQGCERLWLGNEHGGGFCGIFIAVDQGKAFQSRCLQKTDSTLLHYVVFHGVTDVPWRHEQILIDSSFVLCLVELS